MTPHNLLLVPKLCLGTDLREALLRPRRSSRVASERRGMVLVVVLVAVALLALGGFGFSELMLVEREAAGVLARRAQARASAESGVEALRWFISLPPELQQEQGGFYDNPAYFQGAVVSDGDHPIDVARFAVVSPWWQYDAVVGVRFGIEDESSRLNLNALLTMAEDSRSAPSSTGGTDAESAEIAENAEDAEAAGESGASTGGPRDVLMALPGMTESIADAILDFLDEDDEPREFGAEADHYTALVPAYRPKNGPLESIEELLLVRGVTPQLLFGVDMNFNHLRDPDEFDVLALEGVDNSTGAMDRGWAAYLTLHSRESNLRPDGRPKINLNADDLEQLFDDLDEVLGTQWATFIVAYRQFGPYEPDDEDDDGGTRSAGQATTVQLDLTQAATAELETILDLIGAQVEVPPSGEEEDEDDEEREPTVLDSPLMDAQADSADMLGALLDHATLDDEEVIVGRVNVNQAPAVVLSAVPGMTPDVVDAILSRRIEDPISAPLSHRHATWLLVEGLVDVEQMKSLLPWLNGGGHVSRAQVIGYSDGPGPAVRLEAILDAAEQPPRLIRLRDLTSLGRGYGPDVLGSEGAPGPAMRR